MSISPAWGKESTTSAPASAGKAANKPHKWISATMWQAAAETDAKTSAASRRCRAAAMGLTPLSLPQSNCDFSTSPVPRESSPGSTAKASTGMLKRAAGTPRAFWRGLTLGSSDTSPMPSPTLPKCAQRFQEQQSLGRVQLKSRSASADTSRTFCWGDSDSDSDCDSDSDLDDGGDSPLSAGDEGVGSCRPGSPSSLLSSSLPYVQGLLFAESVTQAEAYAGTLAAPLGRSADYAPQAGFALHHSNSGSDHEEWLR